MASVSSSNLCVILPYLLLLALPAVVVVRPSPRMEALKESIRVERSGAAEAFWAEVSKGGGTPLIECPGGLAPNCLVTFLWRGDATTTNVVIRAEAIPGAPAEHR